MSSSNRPPDTDFLDDAPSDARERLLEVHRRLVAAGQPPELPPSLAVAPEPPSGEVLTFGRRYRFTALAAAALLGLGLFGAGYLLGGRTDRTADFTVMMTGSEGAEAKLVVFERDDAGNWPMELEVTGLATLPDDRLYELWLTRDGELAAPCGVFAVRAGTTSVPLNAPYRFRQFDGWVVVPQDHPETVVLRTTEL